MIDPTMVAMLYDWRLQKPVREHASREYPLTRFTTYHRLDEDDVLLKVFGEWGMECSSNILINPIRSDERERFVCDLTMGYSEKMDRVFWSATPWIQIEA